MLYKKEQFSQRRTGALSVTFIMLGHLLITLAIVQVVWTKAKPIDIFNDPGEGDILQLRNLKKNGTKVYNALYSNSDLKWILTDEDGNIRIPYTITGPFNSAGKRAIAVAMKRIAKNTCIRFIERKDEEDYVDLVNKEGEGCYTSVGRIGGRGIVQLESSDDATCMTTPIVMHELMHVAGLWHEHQRYDRDNYIEVMYKNIAKEYHDQFTKVSPFQATTYNVPYDYESLMHYGKRAFAKPNKISMRTRDPDRNT
ncbi:astacin, partial [Cooperia oncophora]